MTKLKGSGQTIYMSNFEAELTLEALENLKDMIKDEGGYDEQALENIKALMQKLRERL